MTERWTGIAKYMDSIFKAMMDSSPPDMIYIKGVELNKLIEGNKYENDKWYEMTNDAITELDVCSSQIDISSENAYPEVKPEYFVKISEIDK